MANRIFFFIGVPFTIICCISWSLIVFTPRYVEYDAPEPDEIKEGTTVENYRMGVIQNCTQIGVGTKVDDEVKLVYGKWGCKLLNWKILTNQIFLAFLSTTCVSFFTLIGAFFTSLVKIILDWVPHDKIKAARILCSRNFGLGLMSAHITAGGFIIASLVMMVILWKFTLDSKGWEVGFNVYLGVAVAFLSFLTALMWFMDVKKVGLVPV